MKLRYRAIGYLLVVSGLLLFPFITKAATYYVDKDNRGGTCSDSNSGQSLTSPLCSIGSAKSKAVTGDTIFVRQGIYNLNAQLDLTTANLQFRGYPDDLEKPILNFATAPSGVGINVRAGGVLVERVEVVNTRDECFQFYWGVQNATMRNVEVHECGGAVQGGVQLLGGVNNILIENSLIHDSASHLLYIGGSNITVRNNIIYHNRRTDHGSYGIQIGTDGTNTPGQTLASNVNIYHNIIGESVNRNGINWYAPHAVLNSIKVNDNIIFGNAQAAMAIFDGGFTLTGTNEIKNNIFFGNSSNNGNCVSTDTGGCIHTNTSATTFKGISIANNREFTSISDMRWYDYASRDFHIFSDSPARDIGEPVSPAVTVDRDGNSRPQGAKPDVGPYEFVSSSDTTPPVISNVNIANITANSALITWITNEPARGTVRYGTNTNLGSSATEASLVTSHSVTVSNLGPGTVYYFSVQSTDAAGNSATDSRGGLYYSFATTGSSFSSYFEAESGAPNTALMVEGSDVGASGGIYLYSTAPDNTNTSVVDRTYSFTAPSGGAYRLWLRMYAPGSSADALYLGFDGTYDRLFPSSYGSYVWIGAEVTNASNNFTHILAPGSHTIRLVHGEPNARADKILVTNDLSFVPTGTGGVTVLDTVAPTTPTGLVANVIAGSFLSSVLANLFQTLGNLLGSLFGR